MDVGSLSNPPECQGLAHFCEHMLFMGSKKYPEENYFASFISRNGGYTNATTRDEATTYNFAVSAEKLKEALDIWAQVKIYFFLQKNHS